MLIRIVVAGLSCSVLGCAADGVPTEAAEQPYSKVEQEFRAATEGRIRRSYSTEPLDRFLGSKVLRIPANYITYFGKENPKQRDPNEVSVYMFLPSYSGVTPENWSQFGKPDRSGLFVRIRAQPTHIVPEKLIADFIASNPPRTTAFGMPAYHFDTRKTTLRLPKTGQWVEYVFGNVSSSGELAYMICQAPDTFLKLPDDPKCEVFALDSAKGLRLWLMFSQMYARDWLNIERRVSGMVGQWLQAS